MFYRGRSILKVVFVLLVCLFFLAVFSSALLNPYEQIDRDGSHFGSIDNTGKESHSLFNDQEHCTCHGKHNDGDSIIMDDFLLQDTRTDRLVDGEPLIVDPPELPECTCPDNYSHYPSTYNLKDSDNYNSTTITTLSTSWTFAPWESYVYNCPLHGNVTLYRKATFTNYTFDFKNSLTISGSRNIYFYDCVGNVTINFKGNLVLSGTGTTVNIYLYNCTNDTLTINIEGDLNGNGNTLNIRSYGDATYGDGNNGDKINFNAKKSIINTKLNLYSKGGDAKYIGGTDWSGNNGGDGGQLTIKTYENIENSQITAKSEGGDGSEPAALYIGDQAGNGGDGGIIKFYASKLISGASTIKLYSIKGLKSGARAWDGTWHYSVDGTEGAIYSYAVYTEYSTYFYMDTENSIKTYVSSGATTDTYSETNIEIPDGYNSEIVDEFEADANGKWIVLPDGFSENQEASVDFNIKSMIDEFKPDGIDLSVSFSFKAVKIEIAEQGSSEYEIIFNDTIDPVTIPYDTYAEIDEVSISDYITSAMETFISHGGTNGEYTLKVTITIEDSNGFSGQREETHEIRLLVPEFEAVSISYNNMANNLDQFREFSYDLDPKYINTDGKMEVHFKVKEGYYYDSLETAYENFAANTALVEIKLSQDYLPIFNPVATKQQIGDDIYIFVTYDLAINQENIADFSQITDFDIQASFDNIIATDISILYENIIIDRDKPVVFFLNPSQIPDSPTYDTIQVLFNNADKYFIYNTDDLAIDGKEQITRILTYLFIKDENLDIPLSIEDLENLIIDGLPVQITDMIMSGDIGVTLVENTTLDFADVTVYEIELKYLRYFGDEDYVFSVFDNLDLKFDLDFNTIDLTDYAGNSFDDTDVENCFLSKDFIFLTPATKIFGTETIDPDMKNHLENQFQFTNISLMEGNSERYTITIKVKEEYVKFDAIKLTVEEDGSDPAEYIIEPGNLQQVLSNLSINANTTIQFESINILGENEVSICSGDSSIIDPDDLSPYLQDAINIDPDFEHNDRVYINWELVPLRAEKSIVIPEGKVLKIEGETKIEFSIPFDVNNTGLQMYSGKKIIVNGTLIIKGTGLSKTEVPYITGYEEGEEFSMFGGIFIGKKGNLFLENLLIENVYSALIFDQSSNIEILEESDPLVFENIVVLEGSGHDQKASIYINNVYIENAEASLIFYNDTFGTDDTAYIAAVDGFMDTYLNGAQARLYLEGGSPDSVFTAYKGYIYVQLCYKEHIANYESFSRFFVCFSVSDSVLYE